MLDPYCRTMEGFARLVHKEWLAFGHRFQTRLGAGNPSGGEVSPVFLLFCDCVHQMVRQFPRAFEFGSSYLVAVVDSAYSGQFGTFLFDSEKERMDAKVYQRCASAWDHLNSQTHLKNPAFVANNDGPPHLFPSTKMMHMALWDRMFVRGLADV